MFRLLLNLPMVQSMCLLNPCNIIRMDHLMNLIEVRTQTNVLQKFKFTYDYQSMATTYIAYYDMFHYWISSTAVHESLVHLPDKDPDYKLCIEYVHQHKMLHHFPVWNGTFSITICFFLPTRSFERRLITLDYHIHDLPSRLRPHRILNMHCIPSNLPIDHLIFNNNNNN